jgi:hypothetical protein
VSNSLAVATVTSTLRRELTRALTASVPGTVPNTNVTTVRPDRVQNPLADPTVNIHLHAATPNPSFRNQDLPVRNGAGRVLARNRAALDLHYVITFHGDEETLVPQRLLAITARTLHAHPVLTRQMIRDTVADAGTFPFLPGSDLDAAEELVRITPAPLTLEEASQFWTMFPQTAAAASLSYIASVVLLDAEAEPQHGPPVRMRNVYVLPVSQPHVERVTNAAGAQEPIVTGSTLLVSGFALRAERTQLRIGGQTIDVVANPPGTEIQLPVPAGLLAGLHGVQVTQPFLIGTPLAPHRGLDSNVAPVLIRPSVARNNAGNFLISVSNVVPGAGNLRSADITFTTTPAVGKRQRLVLQLLERLPPADRAPRMFGVPAPSRDQPAQPDTAVTFTLTASNIEAGDYVVRLQVDGAESVLVADADPDSPTFNQFIQPRVTIP